MNTFETLYSRKSVRKYTGENISVDQLKQILKAAYAAPVGGAKYENLHLSVITNKDYMNRWEEASCAFFNRPGTHPLYGAPTVILVSSATPMNNANYSNAAIVVHNMALAAAELGLGACHIWGAVAALGEHPELVAELNLPEGMVPCCAVILGVTEEQYALREIADERIKTSYMK